MKQQQHTESRCGTEQERRKQQQQQQRRQRQQRRWEQQQQQEAEHEENQFLMLPDDALDRICRLLSLKDVVQLCGTCRDLRRGVSCCLRLPHHFQLRATESQLASDDLAANAVIRIRFRGVGGCCKDEGFEGDCKRFQRAFGNQYQPMIPVLSLPHLLHFETVAFNPSCGHSGSGSVMARRVMEGVRGASEVECPVGLLRWGSERRTFRPGTSGQDVWFRPVVVGTTGIGRGRLRRLQESSGSSSVDSEENVPEPTLAHCPSLTGLCLTGHEGNPSSVRHLLEDLEGAGRVLTCLESLAVEFRSCWHIFDPLAGFGGGGGAGGAPGGEERGGFSAELAQGLSQLKLLRLQNAPLRLLPGVTLPALRRLGELHVFDWRLHFDFDVLVGAPLLTKLTLLADLVTFGSPGLLSSLPLLEHLSVTARAWEGKWGRTFTAEVPVGLPSLTHLSLTSSGRLAFVGELSAAVNLRVLDLRGQVPAQLSFGPRLSEGQQGLRDLDLTQMDLAAFFGQLSALLKLTTLALTWSPSGMQRHGVNAGVGGQPLPTRFLPSSHLRSLQDLNLLDDCSRWGLDGTLPHLTRLRLSLAGLSDFHPSWASYARELRSLSLTLSQALTLQGGPAGLGEAWPRLSDITIAASQLRTFEWDWFAQFGGSLCKLSFTSCEMRELPEVSHGVWAVEGGSEHGGEGDAWGVEASGAAGEERYSENESAEEEEEEEEGGGAGVVALCGQEKDDVIFDPADAETVAGGCGRLSAMQVSAVRSSLASPLLPNLRELDLGGCSRLEVVSASLTRLRSLERIRGLYGARGPYVPHVLCPIYKGGFDVGECSLQDFGTTMIWPQPLTVY